VFVVPGLAVEVELVRVNVDSFRQMLAVVDRRHLGAQLTVASSNTRLVATTTSSNR